MRLLSIALLSAALLVGCSASDEPIDDSASNSSPAPGMNDDTTASDSIVTGTGTVQYIELEGGFYGIVTDDGDKLDPENLPEDLQEDGVRVRFRVTKKENMMTTRMWGTVVKIDDIERL